MAGVQFHHRGADAGGGLDLAGSWPMNIDTRMPASRRGAI
jgi:hypothetical protein